MTGNAWRLTIAAVALAFSSSLAQGEPIASADERGYEVNVGNAKELGYEVRVEVPVGADPKFKRLYLKFPDAIGELRYGHSSVIYSKGGKQVLSFSPESYPTIP